jgi:hypothetical protein
MVDDGLAHRDQGEAVLMLATERATVDQLNQLARAHLVANRESDSAAVIGRPIDRRYDELMLGGCEPTVRLPSSPHP